MAAADPQVLLAPVAMAAVDRAALAAGIGGVRLMERAGRAVTRAITARFAPQPVLVACGPGNNGGDGWVIARRLAAAGWPVRLASLVEAQHLSGDAAEVATRWPGAVEPLDEAHGAFAGLVVDALFGAGLARPLEGTAKAVVDGWNDHGAAVVAVDMPSGVDGSTGAVLGSAPTARLSVTFACAKPGHYLLPGRLHRGELVVADIGLPAELIAREDEGLRLNTPALWAHLLPRRTALDHKYRFGHALIVGGPAATTGAARLSATAALRVGAGLVSIACEPAALSVYAAALTAVMTKPVADAAAFEHLLDDKRLNAVMIGPGAGVGASTRDRVALILARRGAAVLDADALASFADDRPALIGAVHDACVLTPHDGEFAKIFDLTGDRLSRAQGAARACGGVVLLKGGDTVVAAPDGRAAILGDAPGTLATAGTGDVLAGTITGLLAQGLPTFEAACAGAWLHSDAARRIDGLLIAEDLPARLPEALLALA